MLNKLHYVSRGNNIKEQLYNIHQALDNGCDWIQLRYKNASAEDLFDIADSVKLLCDTYTATFIINDNVHLTKQIDADGVHLELTGMKINEARSILGVAKIIGGTANTFEDVIQKANQQFDYIALGPYHYENTKEKGCPILGLEGYQNILQKTRQENITTPIYAGGGIQLNDVENLISCGVHGVAVSGLITSHMQQNELISELNEKLYVKI